MSSDQKTKVGICADHAGFTLKEIIKEKFADTLEFVDFGTDTNESMDYPDVAHPLAKAVLNKDVTWGIAICGSGNGINMTTNKYPGIRSALCWREDIAELARQHNDANVLSLPSRFISTEIALDIVEAFAEFEFEGGRHQRRIEKI